MQRITLNQEEIVDLPLPVALAGAIGADMTGDSIFEIIVAISNG